jgi:hypothetical protein
MEDPKISSQSLGVYVPLKITIALSMALFSQAVLRALHTWQPGAQFIYPS